jgi:hypothetical protein
MRRDTSSHSSSLLGFALILAVLAAMWGASTAHAAVLAPANQFVLLATGGTGPADRGTATINSSTSIIGNVGYGQWTTSTTNQKVDTFTGTVDVHSTVAPTGAPGANWDYTAATFAPSGGVHYGSNEPAVETLLNNARTAALATAGQVQALSPTQTIASINDTSATITSTGAINVIDIGVINLNSDTITFQSRPGFMDTFIIRTSGSFDVSQSTIAMNGTDAGHLLWYFPTAGSHILVNKDSTVFNGTILAPFTNAGSPVVYHNPATFNGAIIARDFDVHSDFNINQVPFTPDLPEPGALGLAVLTCGGAAAAIRRRSRR